MAYVKILTELNNLGNLRATGTEISEGKWRLLTKNEENHISRA